MTVIQVAMAFPDRQPSLSTQRSFVSHLSEGMSIAQPSQIQYAVLNYEAHLVRFDAYFCTFLKVFLFLLFFFCFFLFLSYRCGSRQNGQFILRCQNVVLHTEHAQIKPIFK